MILLAINIGKLSCKAFLGVLNCFKSYCVNLIENHKHNICLRIRVQISLSMPLGLALIKVIKIYSLYEFLCRSFLQY